MATVQTLVSEEDADENFVDPNSPHAADIAGQHDEPKVCGMPLSYFERTILHAKLSSIEAAEDRDRQADLIYRFGIKGTCERSRNAILIVDGVSIAGYLVQANLKELEPVPPSILARLVRENQRRLRIEAKPRVKQRGPHIIDVLKQLNEDLCTESPTTRVSGAAS